MGFTNSERVFGVAFDGGSTRDQIAFGTARTRKRTTLSKTRFSYCASKSKLPIKSTRNLASGPVTVPKSFPST